MSAAPFTAEWTEAFRSAINTSREYREAAREWTWPLALCLHREPWLGYPEDTAILLELEGGWCRAARLGPARDIKAPFIIRGTYDAWKRVVRGELSTVAAITSGALKLEGSLSTVMLHVAAANALVECAAAVPTFFPDEEPFVA